MPVSQQLSNVRQRIPGVRLQCTGKLVQECSPMERHGQQRNCRGAQSGTTDMCSKLSEIVTFFDPLSLSKPSQISAFTKQTSLAVHGKDFVILA